VTEPAGEGNLQRLQKIIAAAGVASRRKAEELILAGRVQINGQTVTELGSKADPEHDHIRVDGKLLQGPERPRYFVVNKPKGYVTTASDPEGRPTVVDLIKTGPRVFPVGRLDYSSEGLLLMTNDGELANALTRAAARVEKTYLVKVSGKPSESALNQLRHGIMIDRGTQISPRRGATARSDDRTAGEEPRDFRTRANPAAKERVMTAPARIRLLREADNPWYEMVLIEGRNREIRKMFEEVGHHVEKIRRVGYGPLVLDLEPGRMRELTLEEVESLRRAAAGRSTKPTKKMPRPGTTRPERATDRKPAAKKSGAARARTTRTSSPRSSSPRKGPPRRPRSR
jgi:23S rRNA pseudouridine2605 synthase